MVPKPENAILLVSDSNCFDGNFWYSFQPPATCNQLLNYFYHRESNYEDLPLIEDESEISGRQGSEDELSSPSPHSHIDPCDEESSFFCPPDCHFDKIDDLKSNENERSHQVVDDRKVL